MFSAPDVAYFSIFGFPIYYYGIILAVAVFVGISISDKIACWKYFLYGIVPRVATPTIIGGIIGARLYYCILNYDIYLKNPMGILAFREGGLSIHGALIGGAIVLYFQAKKYHVNLLKLCDIFSLGLPLAQAIGRWGNFFNQEAFGLPCDLPWKLYISQPYRPDKYFSNKFFHPTFLYESLLDIVIFIVLYKIIMPKYKDDVGVITAVYLLMYSVVRIFIEGLRVDCVRYVFNIPLPQIISFVIIIFTTIFLIRKYKIKKRSENEKNNPFV